MLFPSLTDLIFSEKSLKKIFIKFLELHKRSMTTPLQNYNFLIRIFTTEMAGCHLVETNQASNQSFTVS